jgi:hypothetical protein
MKGDFTRSTFKKENHFHDVRMQQGRVQLDADWNEQLDITAHRVETETKDVVGLCAAPIHHAGFHLVTKATDLTTGEQSLEENLNPPALKSGDFYISGGRFYVDGILCQNERIVPFTKQPDLPENAIVVELTDGEKKSLLAIQGDPLSGPPPPGIYLGYLDIWLRHLTALEEPGIREKALGGPDTTTRTKTICQVKLLQVGNVNAKINCLSTIPAWDNLVAPMTGKMAAQAEKAEEEDKPCILSPGAGYRRLENQFYRVEVHRSGPRGKATFKWSRDNGSIVTPWEKQDVNRLTVSSTGRDNVLNFAGGHWVELTDDTREQLGKPGVLVQLEKVEGLVLIIDPTTIKDPENPAATSVDITKFPGNAKVRRWDSKGEIKPTNSQWITLEDGVQVKFSAGTYRTGDYWWVPARTANADVEWPLDPNTNQPQLQLPYGIRHHYCRLAVMSFDGSKWTDISDCRPMFPPVTALTSLLYVSGDGQEAMPNQPLANHLQVRVVNGQVPVVGARVKFTLLSGGGTLSTNVPVAAAAPDGIAQCSWTLGASGNQQVKAELLDAAGNPIPGQTLQFNANLSTASQVAYNPDACTHLKNQEVNTVQQAIDALCQLERRGGCAVTVGKQGQFEHLTEAIKALLDDRQTDICICLLPGDHELSFVTISGDPKQPNIHLKIVGCGPGTRILLKGTFKTEFLASFTLRDVEITFTKSEEIMMLHTQCQQVTLESCTLTGTMENGRLMERDKAKRIHLENNVINAYKAESITRTRTVFTSAGHGLSALFKLVNPKDFKREMFKVTDKLSRLGAAQRKDMAKKIRTSVREQGTKLSNPEVESYNNLIRVLSADKVDPVLLNDHIKNIKAAAATASPGHALAIIDGNADVTFENNDINGVVSLYGVDTGIILSQNELKLLGTRIRQGNIRLSASTGKLQVRNNRFTRMVIGDSLMKKIKKNLSSEGGELDSLFKSGFITDNLIERGQNQWISEHFNMNANVFLPHEQLGMSVSRFAVFMGNQATDPDLVFFNVRTNSQKAANLLITIADF